jgi:hypothetical protein
MRTKFLLLTVAFVVLWVLWPGTRADVEIVFNSGDTVKGKDVRRDDDDYVLTTFDGGEVRIPYSDVAEVRLLGEPEEPPKDQEPTDDDNTWVPDLKPGKPEELAGQPVKPVTPKEATAVFGEPSKFVQSSYDPNWEPKSALGPDALEANKTEWTQNSYDPDWEPQSAYKGKDWLDEDHAKFQQGPSDPTWVPTDAFAEQDKKEKDFWS